MQGNLNPSARAALAGFIAPAQVAAGTVTTGWVDMRKFFAALAVLNVGAIGAGGTIDAKVQQATDANGTGVKDVPGLAITQLLKAGGDNRQVAINVRPEDLDKTGFRFVRLSVTVGVASTFLAATLLGFDPRYGVASANQSTTVAETVS
ncbi:hypothetical protein [Sphingomonas adhaesiva]|uniref:hypothetical protein n=1 Tax=Sphingomonas adhaesiva TaxID=28212 RepID=UPI002FF77326